MKENVKKSLMIITFILITIVANLCMPTFVHADGESSSSSESSSSETAGGLLDNGVDKAKNFIDRGASSLENKGIKIDLSWIKAIGGIVYGVACAIVIAGTIFAVVKYGMSSAEDKAALKTGLLRWIVTCVIIVGAYPISKWLTKLFDSDDNTLNSINQMNDISRGFEGVSTDNPISVFIATFVRAVQVAGVGYAIIRLTASAISYFTATAAKDKAESIGKIQRSFIIAVIIVGAEAFFELIYRVFFG